MSDFERLLSESLHCEVSALERLGGGDVNDAYRVTLTNGERLFAKTRANAPKGMYVREAEGLRWLAEADVVTIPRVLVANERLLALEWIERGVPARDYDARLGRALARLHQAGAPSFGFSDDNYIGDLPQVNAPLARWSDFYRERRLLPLLTRARERGRLERKHSAMFDALFTRLDQLVGEQEPPARLHGDLWSGNVHVGPDGGPVLIDPSVYGGHREVDLAMLQLFGSLSPSFFAAYDEVHPRAPGYAQRVALYQLYPLLVHVNLFDHGYVRLLESTLASYL
jgi:fructosamine-3-kinase